MDPKQSNPVPDQLSNRAADYVNSSRWVAVESLTAEEPQAALSYWERKRGSRPMPQPRDIDPAEIPRLLPYLTVLDVLQEPSVDYYCRIEGEALRSIYGFRRIRHRLSEYKERFGPEGYASLIGHYDTVRQTGKPLAGFANLAGIGRCFYTIEWVCLPLSLDGVTVHRILSCVGVVKGPGAV